MVPAYLPAARMRRCAPGLRYDEPSMCTRVTNTFAECCLPMRTIRRRSTIDGESLYLLGEGVDAAFELLAAPAAAAQVGAGFGDGGAGLAADAGVSAGVELELDRKSTRLN